MCVRPRRVGVGPVLAVVALAVLALSGCGASAPEPMPSSASSPSASASSPGVPSDGVSLRMLGFVNGPIDAFPVPLRAVMTDRVDQPNAVTLVMSSPSAAELAAYYRRVLPATGFAITADDPATNTLSFAGHGWTGVLTGDSAATAVALRPA